MLIAILALMCWAGWVRKPWWWPIVAWIAAAPLAAYQFHRVNEWAAEAGGSLVPIDVGIANYVLNLVIWLSIYWAARAIRGLFSTKA